MIAVVCPQPLLLLPEYAGRAPVAAPVREACLRGVRELVDASQVTVVCVAGDPRAPGRVPAGQRVAEELLREAGYGGAVRVVVVPADLSVDDAIALGRDLADGSSLSSAEALASGRYPALEPDVAGTDALASGRDLVAESSLPSADALGSGRPDGEPDVAGTDASASGHDPVAESSLPAAGALGSGGDREPDRAALDALALDRDLALLVMADGSNRRDEKAPGYLDERAYTYDEPWFAALRDGDAAALGRLDAGLAADVGAQGRAPSQVLAGAVADRSVSAELIYEDDPFGVAYAVAVWRCG